MFCFFLTLLALSTPLGGNLYTHRRRTQSGCDVPTVCPSRECATAFTSFFAECAGRLASMPEVDPAPYALLFEDCTAKMANGGAGFGAGASSGNNRGGAPCANARTASPPSRCS